MYLTVAKWAGIALLPIGLFVALLLYRSSAIAANGERDVALAEKVTLQVALDTERISTKTAADAADRCAGLVTEQGRRCTAALADDRAQATRYRAQLRGCQSPEVMADRLGALFPPPAASLPTRSP